MSLDPRMARMIREMVQRQHALGKRVDRLNRAQDAGRTTIHRGALEVVDPATGEVSQRIGSDGVEHVGGVVPPQPAAPSLTAGADFFTVTTDGDDIHGETAPDDWHRTRVYASLKPVFETGPATFKQSIWDVDGSVNIGGIAGTWHVCVVWETKSGLLSDPSAIVTVDIEPLVDTQDLEDTLNAAQERLDEYREQVAEPAFQALEEGLSTTADNISDATERLTTAEDTIRPLPGQMAETKADVEAARDEAAAASAAAVEANNRSMTRLANGNFENDLLYWEYQNVTLTDVAHSGQFAATIGTSGWLRPESSMPVVPDQIWELSLYHQGFATVTFQSVVDGEQSTIDTFNLDGTPGQWADSGSLRVTIPAGVDMLTFTLSGTGARVDDITLRDVTDVVRLEQAANANRQKAEQAVSELAVMRLAVDGEGGLKDRLASAETTLETKADESALDQLDQKLATNLAAFEAHYTRVWRQADPPPPGVHYAWLGEPHASVSVRLDGDGNETARNLATNPAVTSLDGFLGQGGVTNNDLIYVDQAVRMPIVSASSHGLSIPGRGNTDYGGTYTMALRLRASRELPLRLRIGNTEVAGDPLLTEWQWYVVRLTAGASHNTGLVVRSGHEIGDWVEIDRVLLSPDDETYFDGDTESDRAHDLWYNADGVPHEWVNGQGWTILDDHRINQLQTDVVEAAETAYLDRLVVRDEIITPETITNRLWAELGVFNRLQAREGWIGGVNLENDTVTAEKVEATREMITKILGAEWAYIAQQLIVDGSILTRDLEALSAAIQSLTVTQRADIAELWAEELWTALAVIEELQAEEAWITSAMISELTAEKVTVTQNFVGRIAELLHLVVDRIDANAIWADQTWQNAGYFGAEGGGFRTTVNGQGILTEQEADGEYLPASQLGGPEQALTFWDENQEPTATVERSGDAAFQLVEAGQFEHQGRPLFAPDPFVWHDGPILDALPRGIIDQTPQFSMVGTTVTGRTAYGFLEVAGQVEAGRVYRVHHSPFHMGSDADYYAEYTYTFSNTDTPPPAPHTESDRLENTRWRVAQQNGGPNTTGEIVFTATETGTIRVLLVVGRSSSGTGISFISSGATYGRAQLTLEDIGPARRWNGVRRYAAHGGTQTPDRDPVVLSQGYTTAWTPTWQQVYRGNSTSVHHTHTTNSVIQGRDEQGNFYSSLLGGYQTNPATRGDHAGQTIQQALTGRTVIGGRIIAVGTAQNQTGVTNFYWHAHGQPPATVRNDTRPPNYIANRRDRAGTIRVSQLPNDALAAIQNGTFQGVTIHPVPNTGSRDLRSYHGIGGITNATPVTIELTYEENQ